MRLTLIVVVILGSALAVFSQSADTSDPLVRVLQAKGILTETEARAITTNASPAEQRDRLATLARSTAGDRARGGWPDIGLVVRRARHARGS